MKRLLSICVCLAMLISLFAGITVSAAFPGDGDGTKDSPYIVTNAEQFAAITGTNYYRIEAAADNGKIVLPEDFTPISNFRGIIEGVKGKNTIVLNAKRSSGDSTGTALFFNLTNGHIENLVIEGTIVGGNSGGAGYTAALAGYIHKSATDLTLKNITNKANITITYDASKKVYSSGLVGFIQATSDPAVINIQNCVNEGTITYTGTQIAPNIGGIVGEIEGGANHTVTIDGCRNGSGDDKTGIISSPGVAAGIVGTSSASNCTIQNCSNLGKIDLQNKTQGAGIVANMTNGVIKQCFNAGEVVNGNGGCGGIAYIASTGMTVKDCYNVGTVTGSTGGAAGIVYNIGRGLCTVSGCYNAGNVSGTTNNVGPIYAATNAASISACYHLPGSYGKVMESTQISSEALKDPELPKGFDSSVWRFTTQEADGTFYLYPQLDSNIYYLQLDENFLDFAGGCGTPDYPYLIADKAQLANVSLYPSASFKLLANIEDAVTEPINGENDFTGSFDGNGKTIALNIASEGSYTGLFSRIVNGVVSNLTVTGSVSGGWTEGTVDGSKQPISGTGAIAGGCSGTSFISCISRAKVASSAGNAVGGIVGDAYYYPKAPADPNSFTQCKNYGAVTGSAAYVGGIVGVASNYSAITNCANYGDVSAGSTIGGITGKVYGVLTDCLNAGTITASSLVGGISGEVRAAYGTNGMENCYNIGTVQAKAENGTASAFGTTSHTANLKFTNCYNAGDILSPGTPGQKLLSRTVGNYTVTYTNCYALTANAEADGLSGIDGVTPVDKAGLKTAALGSAYRVDASAAYPYPQLTANQQTEAWDFALLTVTAGENGTQAMLVPSM